MCNYPAEWVVLVLGMKKVVVICSMPGEVYGLIGNRLRKPGRPIFLGAVAFRR